MTGLAARYLRLDCQSISTRSLTAGVGPKPEDLKLVILVVLRDNPNGLDIMLKVMDCQLADVAF